MQIKVLKSQIPDPENFIRRSGYGIVFDKRNRSIKSFVKRLHRDLYPRFHLYLQDQGNEWVFNLHLDQRAPVYEGQTAHAGEYDGEVVEREAERIKQLL
jgi:hypothetical protein